MRRAKRLVALEIDTLRIEFGTLSGLPRLPSEQVTGHKMFLPSHVWEQHSSVLAAALSDHEWQTVAVVYDTTSAIKLNLTDTTKTALDDEKRTVLRDMADLAASAQAVLGYPPTSG